MEIKVAPSFLFYFIMGSGQEVSIEGQDKVFKDVIEPLESVSVNIIPTGKQNIKEFGPPQQVRLVSERIALFLKGSIAYLILIL